MKLSHIYFNFNGETVRVSSNSDELLSRLEKDFSYFKVNEISPARFAIKANFDQIPDGIVPAKVADRQSLNSLTFDQGEIRINDYYGKLLSVYDYKKESATLWSVEIEKLHEITYLLVLSRVGKALDMRGLHKVHAMAFTLGNTSAIGMMPMKGGKSTLLANVLRDQSVAIVSDDCPLIDRQGRLLPFPLRLGVDSLAPEVGLKSDSEFTYTLQRDFYGEKKLVSLAGLPHEVGRVGEHQILFVGRRAPGLRPQLHRVSRLSMIKPLIYNMVIGIGLPMVMEYFWQNGFKDFVRKSFIALSRAWSALALLSKSECYQFWMCENPEENAEFLLRELKKL